MFDSDHGFLSDFGMMCSMERFQLQFLGFGV